jgi:hypothetical protein
MVALVHLFPILIQSCHGVSQMADKKRPDNALHNLLASTGSEVLRDLVSALTSRDPEVRRESFEYLKGHALLSTTLKQTSDGEVVLALWEELYPDLEEMDDCGGGDYHVVDHVGDLLGQIREDILKSEERWRDFAGKIKRETLRRPALQEEFAGAMPGWGELP